MPKRTILDITQTILSDMDSDEVNSINDTTEALQVANVIRDVYYDLVEQLEIPHKKELVILSGLANTAKPTHVQIPEGVRSLEWIKYNKITLDETDPDWEFVLHKEPVEFLELIHARNLDDTEVISVTDFSGAQLLIRNDKAPSYYTSFDDTYVIFDSFDSEVESSIQTSKLLSYGVKEDTLSLTDTFIPDLPAHLFPLLVSESKAKCFSLYKQVQNTKEEVNARRHRAKWQRNKNKVPEQFGYNAYGR